MVFVCTWYFRVSARDHVFPAKTVCEMSVIRWYSIEDCTPSATGAARAQEADVAQGRLHAGTLSRRVGAPRNMYDYSGSLHLCAAHDEAHSHAVSAIRHG